MCGCLLKSEANEDISMLTVNGRTLGFFHDVFQASCTNYKWCPGSHAHVVYLSSLICFVCDFMVHTYSHRRSSTKKAVKKTWADIVKTGKRKSLVGKRKSGIQAAAKKRPISKPSAVATKRVCIVCGRIETTKLLLLLTFFMTLPTVQCLSNINT